MRYGQKGGDGPNTGKTAANYTVVLPTGKTVKKRVFNGVPVKADGTPVINCVAALLPPHNGHDWMVWVIAASKETMPDYVQKAPGNEAIVYVAAVYVPGKGP